MATLDIPRAAVRLSDAELGAAVMLIAQPDHPLLAEPASQEAVASLEAAGMLADGRPTGYPARLLGIVAAPKLRVSVESFFAGDVRLEQAWANETEGVLGAMTGDGEIELSAVEPALLPWAIARWIGLGPREHGEREPLEVPAPALGAAEEAVLAGSEDDARAALEGVDGGERLLQVLLHRRLSWRATSAWSDDAGDHVASVAVLDAGSQGLWLTDHRGEEPMIHLEPVQPSTVWERIVALMPHEGAP